MANIFEITFGETGAATQFFSGNWWLVGLLILIVFIAFLARYGVPAEGIILFTIIMLLLVGVYSLFLISESIIQTILLILFIYVGWQFYLWVTR